MATFKSGAKPSARAKYGKLGRWVIWANLFLLTSLAGLQASDGPTELQKKYAPQTAQRFEAAKARYLADTNNVSAAGQLAAACFASADAAESDAQRADFARLGVAAAKVIIASNGKLASGHYYLAENYGQLAKAEAPSLAAYRLVKELEREFKIAAELDERYDFAGPVRCLGVLYRDAPGWPLSIGSKRKAKEYLERAALLASNFPENRLNLAESYLRWHDTEAARKELNAVDEIWSNAQKQLTGPIWAENWEEWTQRRAELHRKLDKAPPATGATNQNNS